MEKENFNFNNQKSFEGQKPLVKPNVTPLDESFEGQKETVKPTQENTTTNNNEKQNTNSK